ncbi:SGNH hydrolase [Vararia minispora EC-137]|uniref:SGNH hydrolase n=1 Tax=Vararia minispora EC-137 TaxID=1314806 RepID=A0ACB8QKE4_9AGAM|nr:SGNH hydrolase [Vararia minispora EC-137]
MLYLVLSSLFLAATIAVTSPSPTTTTIAHDDPRIFYHGRWDKSSGTWWGGSGIKLCAEDLTSLALTLGPHTSAPSVSLGVSFDYASFVTMNASEGVNEILLPEGGANVVRINAEGWQNNRMNLLALEVDSGAKLSRYTPSHLAFQFIGDSLSAGQFLPQGVDQAWPFLVGESFRAEHNINAQPGATLTDMVSYGNVHGIAFQFFQTEDTGYYYTMDHNFTTPWHFSRDIPPTHVVIHIGANDASQNVTQPAFISTYLHFFDHLRELYPHQPIFVFTPWGWPNADGTISYYYDGAYQEIVDTRHETGDKNVFLVNTTGWMTWEDVFPDNQHPTVPGHAKIAGLFKNWLEKWGLHAAREWATLA